MTDASFLSTNKQIGNSKNKVWYLSYISVNGKDEIIFGTMQINNLISFVLFKKNSKFIDENCHSGIHTNKNQMGNQSR